MPFRIVNVETGNFYISSYTGSILEFETGDEAQHVAKELALAYGTKYRVKKVLNTEWRERELRKMNDGTYTPLPWSNQTWWYDPKAVEIHQEQFPHVSRKEPGMVAYTESAEKGMENIVTRCKPGRYLDQFRDILTVYSINPATLAKDFTNRYQPREMRFAVTEDEIQWVYENGPPSCMSSKGYRQKNGWGYPEPGLWPNDYHACRVYAAGDLQVAWLAKDDEKPLKRLNVLARAVVWPARKTHSRCYGDEYKMRDALKTLGYKFSPPMDAKLLRKPFNDVFIVPYLDVGSSAGDGSMWVRDDKTHLTIVPRGSPLSYAASSTSGLSGHMVDARGRPVQIGECGRCHAPNVPYREVFINGTDRHRWCDQCCEGNTYQCGYDGRLYDPTHVPPVEMADGSVWNQRQFSARGFTCQGSGLRYPRDNNMVKLRTGELYHITYAQSHAATCYYTGNWHRKDDLIQVYSDGQWRDWGPEAARLYTLECTECNKRFYSNAAFIKIRPTDGRAICFTCESPSLPLPGQASETALTQIDRQRTW